MKIKIRKYQTAVEEIHHEGGPPADKPVKHGAVCAVVHNPFAGRYEENLMDFMEALKPLSLDMAKRLIDALGGKPEALEAYGKGAIVGVAGEIEHAATWHAPGGGALRDLIPGAQSIVPATKKVGALGCSMVVPMLHIMYANVRSHYNAMEVCVFDAPRPDELIFIQVAATGGRIHQRLGGRKATDRDPKFDIGPKK